MSNKNFNEIYSKVISSKYLKKTYDSFSISTLISKSGQNLFLPFYHTISNKRLPHIENIYPVRNEKLFINDLDLILKHFDPISIYELEKKVKTGKLFKNPSFHLTFDDGLSEIYTVIAPILEEKGIPATFFINTGFVDNKALFYRYKVSLIIEKLRLSNDLVKQVADVLSLRINDIEEVSNALLFLNYDSINLIDTLSEMIELSFDDYLKNNSPYLTTDQINDLIKRGFTIGSHSIYHPFFKEISVSEQKNQVTESFRILFEKFGISNKYFSFPFSDDGVTIEFFDWLYDVEKCDLSFGTSGLKQDYSVKHIHRVAFDGSLSPAEDIVKLQYFNYIVKSMMNKNYMIRL